VWIWSWMGVECVDESGEWRGERWVNNDDVICHYPYFYTHNIFGVSTSKICNFGVDAKQQVNNPTNSR
jgi:hypothetical protein